MRYGSMCSGIGGLDLAVEAVFGATPAWFCENDPHAATILARHWPGVPVLPDLKTQDWSRVEPVELLCAGYPCQPFSHAGRRGGADDPRHLWPHVARAVRVLRPRIVVLENVAGHLGLGFDAVLADLAEAGFDAEWRLVRASDVGACHRRERLFVVATDARCGDRCRGAWGEDADGGGRPESAGGGQADQHGRRGSPAAHPGGPGAGRDSRGAPVAQEPDRRRTPDHTDPSSVHRGVAADPFGRGRAGRPPEPRRGPLRRTAPGRDSQDAAADANGRGLEGGAQLDSQPEPDTADWCPCGRHADRCCDALPPDADGGGRGEGPRIERGLGAQGLRERPAPDADVEGLEGRQPAQRPDMPAWGDYGPAIRRWERCLGRPAPAPVDRKGRLSVPFVEWMQGFPAGWVDGLTRTAALRCLGNAVVPQQGAYALATLKSEAGGT